MRRRPPEPGMSLIEVLIASTVLLLVIGLVTTIITYTMRALNRTQPQAATEGAVLAVATCLREELRTAMPSSIYIITGTMPARSPARRNQPMASPSIRPGSDDTLAFSAAELEYQKQEIIYDQAGNVRLQQNFMTPGRSRPRPDQHVHAATPGPSPGISISHLQLTSSGYSGPDRRGGHHPGCQQPHPDRRRAAQRGSQRHAYTDAVTLSPIQDVGFG